MDAPGEPVKNIFEFEILDGNGDSILISNCPCRCDPDLNNDLKIDFADLAELKSVFFTPDADADLNGDSRVDFADLSTA